MKIGQYEVPITEEGVKDIKQNVENDKEIAKTIGLSLTEYYLFCILNRLDNE